MANNVHNPSKIDPVDLIVGIPSYNEADSIAYPTQVAQPGHNQVFSR